MRSAQTRWHHSQAVVMAPAEGPLGVKPVEKGELGTETEAEKHLKRMLDKQLNTKFTMKEHFSKHREFTASSTYTPLAELISGAHSLEEFSQTEKAEEMYKELQRSGLTEEEIALYVAHTTGKEVRMKFIEPSILQEKIKLIEDKLKSREDNLCRPQVFTGAKSLSRHEMDIEKSLYAGCGSKSGFSSLLINQSSLSDETKCYDAFAYIKQVSQKYKEKCKKKRKRVESDLKTAYCSNKCEVPHTNALKIDSENVSEFRFDPSIHHVVVPLNPNEVEHQRITIAEIRQLPKFSSYDPGEPSKVLYLKNLHAKVTVQELIALFGSFDLSFDTEESTNYRLLTGRMKGQAFVTFPDDETAEKALQLVNGYLLRGRPVIIEFGRKGAT